jgi:hypothetical protein
MKTLFEKLKPEYIEKLNIEKVNFPYSTNSSIDDLSKNFIIGTLKYETIIFFSLQILKLDKLAWYDVFNLFDYE